MKDIEYEYYERSNNGFCYQFTMEEVEFWDLQKEIDDLGVEVRFVNIEWMDHPQIWGRHIVCISFKYKSDAVDFKMKWC